MMKKPSVFIQVQEALGITKIEIVAREIDRLRSEIGERASGIDVDESIETINLNHLAQEQGVPLRYLREQIAYVMGTPSAFKMGRTWIIRKTTWLEFLKRCEQGTV